MLVALLTFTLAAGLLVLLPGPDTLVILRSIVRDGRRSAVATVLGIQTGLICWITAAVLGLTALLRASEIAYDVLRYAGAAYLLWLGVQSLRRRSSAPDRPVRFVGTGFRGGLLTNLLNPKVGVFFVTFLPGFVPAGYPVTATLLLFGVLFVVLNLSYQLPLVALADRVSAWFARPRTRRRLDAVAGTVLIGFGIRLAVES